MTKKDSDIVIILVYYKGTTNNNDVTLRCPGQEKQWENHLTDKNPNMISTYLGVMPQVANTPIERTASNIGWVGGSAVTTTQL